MCNTVLLGVGARVYGSLVILVSAQVLLVLTLGLWTPDLGQTKILLPPEMA